MFPASTTTRSPFDTPRPASAAAVRSTRSSGSRNESARPWNRRASLAGKSSAASRTRSARFTRTALPRRPSRHLDVLAHDGPSRGEAGEFGVGAPPGLEQGQLLEAAVTAFEHHQPAGGDLRVVAPPLGAGRVLVARADHRLRGRLDPAGDAVMAVGHVQVP